MRIQAVWPSSGHRHLHILFSVASPLSPTVLYLLLKHMHPLVPHTLLLFLLLFLLIQQMKHFVPLLIYPVSHERTLTARSDIDMLIPPPQLQRSANTVYKIQLFPAEFVDQEFCPKRPDINLQNWATYVCLSLTFIHPFFPSSQEPNMDL
jgi:hypothetical protein